MYSNMYIIPNIIEIIVLLVINNPIISSNCNNSCFKDSYQNINTPKMMIVSEDVLMMFENQITELKNLVASLRDLMRLYSMTKRLRSS